MGWGYQAEGAPLNQPTGRECTMQRTKQEVERDRRRAWIAIAYDAPNYVKLLMAQQTTETLEEWHADADWLRAILDEELRAREKSELQKGVESLLGMYKDGDIDFQHLVEAVRDILESHETSATTETLQQH